QMSINIAPNKNHTNGIYIVFWKTVSTDDGDSAEGTFSFMVNTSGASASPTPTTTTPAATNSNSTSAGVPLWVPLVVGLVALLVGLGAGLILGRRKPAPAASRLGTMRSAIAQDL